MAKQKKNTIKTASGKQSAAQVQKYVNKTRNKGKEKQSAREYFKGVRQEMSKVVWPTKKELGAYTVAVLVTCIVFALGFWAIDSGFLAILRHILGITMN